MWPGVKSRRRRYMWVEFVVGSLLSYERFFSGYSGFPLPLKTNILKFQFDQESGGRRITYWMRYLETVIYLFCLFVFLPFHWLKTHHVTCILLPINNRLLMRSAWLQIIFCSCVNVKPRFSPSCNCSGVKMADRLHPWLYSLKNKLGK